MKTKSILLLVVSALVGLSLGYFGLSLPKLGYTFHGSLIEPPIPAIDFSLLDQDGQTFTLSEQRGKVVLLFFGYTSCPDVCPATLGKYKQIAQQLGEQAEQVRFVMVTTNPERDTTAQLATYLGEFNPAFIGLRGPEEILQIVYQSYWVSVEKETEDDEIPGDDETPGYDTSGYTVAHASQVYLIDPAGNLRLFYWPEIGAEAMAQDIGYLLKTADP
ncbi:MAG: SCO family protein [Anaerolineales bacterium]